MTETHPGAECNCIECQAERHYGKPLLEFTDEEIESTGGCRYCCMTGYEDYPSMLVPCRRGHEDPSKYVRLPPLPEPTEGKPKVGGPWVWTGRGWNNMSHPYRKERAKDDND